jgi:MFS family permease
VHPGIVEATREAVRYAREDRHVLALFGVRLGVGFAIGVVALLPVLARAVYHAGNRGTGLLFAFRGVGSLIGPFLIRPVIRRDDRRRLFTAAVWTPALFAIAYGALPWMPGIYLAGVAAMAAQVAGGAQWTLVTYSYQSTVPDRILGRVFGFDGALITFTFSASNALCGWLAGLFGVRIVMAGAGAAVLAYCGLLWLLTRSLRRTLSSPRAPIETPL